MCSATRSHSAWFTYLTLFVAFGRRASRGASSVRLPGWSVGASPTVLHNHSSQLSVAINTTRRVWIAQKIGNNCQFIFRGAFMRMDLIHFTKMFNVWPCPKTVHPNRFGFMLSDQHFYLFCIFYYLMFLNILDFNWCFNLPKFY